MAKTPAPKTTDEKLDVIIDYLRKLNHRDRLRMWGGLFRGLLGLIPTILFLLSIWYVYAYGDQLLEKMAEAAARQASNVVRVNPGSLVDGLDLDSLLNQLKR
ncbi:MAG: hypothetical protein PHO92_02020 [Candidatus Peribacteraceae bacterium]|nr:hypothetical protein [Candidatus Peribacteraceae bacterium]